MEQVVDYSLEARKARVLQALHTLAYGEADGDEQALLVEFRPLRAHGFGRMEVILVDHRIEGINLTKTKKRKDLIISPKST